MSGARTIERGEDFWSLKHECVFVSTQLQHLVCDDICVQTLDLYLEERKQGATGGAVGTAHQRLNAESVYQRKSEQLLSEENCFKIAMVRKRSLLLLPSTLSESFQHA